MSPVIKSYDHFIAITDRTLCRGSFTDQVQRVCSLHPRALILREKDLPDDQYALLAREIQEICRQAGVPFFVHGRPGIARQIGCRCLHLPLPVLRSLGGSRPEGFERGSASASQDSLSLHERDLPDAGSGPAAPPMVSVSCHSMEDMREAVAAGADFIILGTIFETQCKKGLRGKGPSFVKEICDACPVPVYAIGGIREDNIDLVLQVGAAGGCMMSGFMQI